MSPLGICFTFAALCLSILLAFFDILEWGVDVCEAQINLYFLLLDFSQRYILMKASDSNQGEKKPYKFCYGCSFCAEGRGQKNDQESFSFVSNTLQMTVCCFPGPLQALEMGAKGSQWVKANS